MEEAEVSQNITETAGLLKCRRDSGAVGYGSFARMLAILAQTVACQARRLAQLFHNRAVLRVPCSKAYSCLQPTRTCAGLVDAQKHLPQYTGSVHCCSVCLRPSPSGHKSHRRGSSNRDIPRSCRRGNRSRRCTTAAVRQRLPTCSETSDAADGSEGQRAAQPDPRYSCPSQGMASTGRRSLQLLR